MLFLLIHIKLIQDGGAKYLPPTILILPISTNVRTSSKNFLNFSFNPFPTLAHLKARSNASPKFLLLNLYQEYPSKSTLYPWVKTLETQSKPPIDISMSIRMKYISGSYSIVIEQSSRVKFSG